MTAVGPDLLRTMAAAAIRIVEVRREARPESEVESAIIRTPEGPRFEAALREGSGFRILAECKRRSPSRGILRERYDPAAHARAYADAGAVAISVLTEPTFFDGAPEHLAAVREAVSVPLLRKDFIVSEYQILEAAALGADAVLLIVGGLDEGALKRLMNTAGALGLAALVEVHDSDELHRAIDTGAAIIGVNSRNLRTLAVEQDVFELLASDLPRHVVAVAESGIRSHDDLVRLAGLGYRAFLVGERLITQPDPGAALRELVRGYA